MGIMDKFLKKVMEDDLLSPENVVFLYVFWSSMNYSDWYINDLTDSNPKIYYIKLGTLGNINYVKIGCLEK
ncbi:hypothetical protein RI543_000219 [Arxiozyma heterogenica]|uniref:Uncharacterized protein n=1 Tax=Arxiozyma heterogenica TaxID=278026 RepID=A0AAN7WP20_9SACH|nr:hypothetical protein RI543_000219 [Kazachstania heterogenica]